MDQNILRTLLGKIDCVLEQLALVFINAAVLLHFVDKHQKLLLRHFVVGAEAEDLRQQLFPERKNCVQRRKNPNKDLKHRRGQHGPLLCAVLCNALRRDLTENQHHDRDDDGGDRGACVAVMPDEQHGADGGRGDIHDIVSDQDRGQQPVIAFEQLTDQCRPFVSLLCKGLEPRCVRRGKSRFCRRKIAGEDQADSHYNNASRG